ncbi:hypothetical protein BGZ61DRAFT_372908 [Ilyonectria robusta]|uniref:uncharacterized protein n=1 Tax=Ilyonectria robusta TaxID=1079257 RepID=UPI001E8DD7FE|nr:uncharacterized protein BGZ61DRAFT_372908 [Ilyonectria robusta]KAH8654920.1 hypothetical protein BGZ61DRAFT_372908 [Ilyonectria robusta]
MRLFSYTTVLLAAFITATGARPANPKSGAPYCPPRSVTPRQQRAIFEEFVHKLYIKRNITQALLDHMPEDYIQHNPFVLSGRDNGIEGLSFVSPDTVNFTIARLEMDRDIAFVHSRLDRVDLSQPTAVVDLLRFEGSCLVEHWDVLQEVPDNGINLLDMW